MPALLIETPFVQNVAERITTMVGVTPALLGVVGTVWLAVRRQFVPLALFLGYLAYIPAFTWHTSIGHSYYHVHLIPLIAIGFSPLAASLIRRLPRQPLAGYSLGIVVVAIHLVITHYAFTGPWRWMPGTREFVDASRKEVLAEAETGREIGAITGPGASCIVLSKGLGLPLEYHAWVRTEWWPRWEEMVYIRYTFRQEKFDPVKFMEEMLVKHDPQYFVITDLVEFESHAYLRILLQRYFPKSIASNDRYRIYGR